ncbi:hypothetical protein [Streptomyces alkaliphilus]|uniref:hypothetical protein n=1 Tax=Streptomyces alkaliphilus TaxID=1472722 RepID=UPI00117E5E39|nr:hypothetical protein [Streptomyces alkaliphilus]MQS08438.1 hypothetical protein [Streptomyces alkaliphilus]
MSDEHDRHDERHDGHDPDPVERALWEARARVLADLASDALDRPDVVSRLDEAMRHRRWWVEQWPRGAEFVAGLLAQDVQDAVLDSDGRWPACPLCVSGAPGAHAPHPLEVRPELGPDPHWVCPEKGVTVAAVGRLGRSPRQG